jgi:hypothetical protein
MAKEPEQRYQTVGEMERALQAALKEIESGASTMNVPAIPTGSTQQLTGAAPAPKKSSMAGPLLIGGGVVVVLLCLVGGGLAAFGLMASSTGEITPTVANRTPVSIGIEKTATPTPISSSLPTDEPSLPTDTPTPTPETELLDGVAVELTAAAATLEVELTAAAATLDSSLDLLTGEGEVLLEDDFTSNQNEWHTGVEDDEYGHTEYELVDGRYRITQEALQGVFAWSNLTDTDYDNFVLSVETTPVEHTAPFAYGITVRENSAGDLYAFEIDTDGYFTINLRSGGKWKTLKDWSQADTINSGGTNQLMVKAIGSSLTFLINEQEVATVEDETLDSGAIGLALDVFNKGDKATIDFDNLVVRQLTPAELALVDTSDSSGAIIFEDTFDSDVNGWATGSFDDEYSQDKITIQDGRYTLSVTSKPDKFPYVEKVLPNRKFGDFILTLEATPRDSETHYSYGVAFREDKDANVYAFEIGNDGLYSVLLYDQEWKKLKDWSSSPAIKPGQTNVLTVSAIGNTLTFYVNDVQLTTLQDNALAEGDIGLVVDMGESGKSATVDFDNLVIREP